MEKKREMKNKIILYVKILYFLMFIVGFYHVNCSVVINQNSVIGCFCKKDASSKNDDNYIIYCIGINTIIYRTYAYQLIILCYSH